MIYLDNAATSLLKPPEVARAMLHAMRTMASPGRGGHEPAALAAETAYKCREELSQFFHAPGPEHVAFTMNATHALNIALNTLVRAGDRVVISGYEHNAVTRPLHMLGADIDVARSPLFDRPAALEAFRAKLPGARCCVCTHVSNVFGFVLPVEGIAELCREQGVPFVLDASQSAGVLPVDMEYLGAEFVAMPGHKGLLGPQGTGVLLCRGRAEPIMAGGTGSESRSQSMPQSLPDALEAGTHNIPGIAGLLAGLRYVERCGLEAIDSRERALKALMCRRLEAAPGLEVFASDGAQAGVLSVRSRAIGSEELAAALAEKGVAVRAGLHCAPLAHKSAGTIEGGTVRFSFSPFNNAREVERAAAALAGILKMSPQGR